MRRNLATVAVALLVYISAISLLRFQASGQPPPPNPIRYVTADPTGTACGATSIALRTPIGNLYTCQNGLYALVPPVPYANYANVGALVPAYFGVATASDNLFGGGDSSVAGAVCGNGNSMQLFPVAGMLRNPYVVTSGSQGSGVVSRYNLLANCSATNTQGSTMPSGIVILPGQAAGTYTSAVPNYFLHINQGDAVYIQMNKSLSGGTAATTTTASAEFVSDDGIAWTPVLSRSAGQLTTASSTLIAPIVGGFSGGTLANTSETALAIPMPFAGTIKNGFSCIGASPTVTAPWTLRLNGVTNTTMTFSNASTDTASSCATDTTHTVAVAQGDYATWQIVTGATTQFALSSDGFALRPTAGNHTGVFFLLGATAITTARFTSAGGTVIGNQTTDAAARVIMPMACAATNLYIVQSAANGAGVTTTVTVEQNGADSALTGTVAPLGSTGSLALDTTHTVNFAKGDAISLKYITNTGTSGAMGGAAIQCN